MSRKELLGKIETKVSVYFARGSISSETLSETMEAISKELDQFFKEFIEDFKKCLEVNL